MRISVIVPCRNAETWVAEALRSAHRQTLTPHEIIVVDDDSTDESMVRVRESGVPVRVLHAASHNAATSRNVGIRLATGDWIAFLDADDVWFPEHLERAHELLASGEAVAFMGNFAVLSLDGRTSALPRPVPLTVTRTGLTLGDFLPWLTQNSMFGHSSVLYRRDRVLEAGGFDEEQLRVHDMDLFIRVVQGRTWCYDHALHSAYRVDTPDSVSKHPVSRPYFALRMLLKHRGQFGGTEFDRLVERTARHATSVAITDGTAEDRARVRRLAGPLVPMSLRWCMVVGTAAPGLARWMVRAGRGLRKASTTL
jgi:glycosyltransferase involved in cell wall biosynthesis